MLNSFIIVLISALYLHPRTDTLHYSIERVYYSFDYDKYELSHQAYKWTEAMGKQYQHGIISDYRTEPQARALTFIFFGRKIIVDGRKYDVNYNFTIAIYPEDHKYTVRLEDLTVSASLNGRWGILSTQQIPKIEEEYGYGDFAFKRHHKDKVAVSKEMKKIAKADFEYLLPTIKEYMSGHK